jgi:hypothetical protein
MSNALLLKERGDALAVPSSLCIPVAKLLILLLKKLTESTQLTPRVSQEENGCRQLCWLDKKSNIHYFFLLLSCREAWPLTFIFNWVLILPSTVSSLCRLKLLIDIDICTFDFKSQVNKTCKIP